MTLVPFADDAASMAIGKLTVENGTDQVSVYPNLDITRDKGGLANARVLKSLLDQIIQRLTAEKNLPETVVPNHPPKTARNPSA